MFKVINIPTNQVIAIFGDKDEAIAYANQQNAINAHIGDSAKYEVVSNVKS